MRPRHCLLFPSKDYASPKASAANIMHLTDLQVCGDGYNSLCAVGNAFY